MKIFSVETFFYYFFFKIDNIPITKDPDPNWANFLEPDPIPMYLDPQHRA